MLRVPEFSICIITVILEFDSVPIVCYISALLVLFCALFTNGCIGTFTFELARGVKKYLVYFFEQLVSVCLSLTIILISALIY